MEIEKWLDDVDRAPKTKAHIRDYGIRKFSIEEVSALFNFGPFNVASPIAIRHDSGFNPRLDKIARNLGNSADADATAFIVSVGIVLMLIALPTAVLGGFWLYYFNRLTFAAKQSTTESRILHLASAPHLNVGRLWATRCVGHRSTARL
jgi:hypothetical protein